jgi:dihydrofolate reductase
MRKLISFTNVTLNGYFADANSDMSWAHQDPSDVEWNEFVAGNASGGGTLLFGRVTYEMMASYWPTPLAAKNTPVVAEHMNSMPKVVFSRTLDKPSWQNTRLVKGNLAAEVKKLKNEPGDGMAILGSGSIVAQLAQERLIDELQVVVHPIILGAGKTLFGGVTDQLQLKRTATRCFKNGNVYVCYEPA